MTAGSIAPGTRFPVIVEPDPGARSVDAAALVDWVIAHRDWLGTALADTGGVLIRNFDVRSAGDFREVMSVAFPPLIDYVGGNSPRRQVLDQIYTSTEYPAELDLAIHNEMACAQVWPSWIAFCCITPSPQGGETPLLDCRRVLAALSDPVRERFRTEPVQYLRRMRSKNRLGVGKSWQDAFGTDDRGQVESLCRKLGMELEWTEHDGLQTVVTRKAITTHPGSGAEVWFNQILLFHPSSQVGRVADAQRRLAGGRPGLDCRFASGAIDDAMISEIRRVTAAHEVVFAWRSGDVLLLDNMLVAHGRRAFSGARQVLAAMA